jgi:hypothetical protein
VRPIAAGGFGEVFLARQKGLDRNAVVKLLRLSGDEDADAARRFSIEARATALIRHENVVRVLDSGAETTPWIAYEFCDGDPLRDRLARGAMPVTETLAVMAQVAAALEAAHAAGVLHRDVKPDNVLSMADGTWKLADFGIAKWAEGATLETAAGTVLGTPSYMAPEIIGGEPAVAATDVYALGVMFYEALVGEVPYRADHPLKVLEQHLRAPVPRPRAKGVNAAVEVLVASCLAKSPGSRPAAHEVRKELEAQLAAIGGALSVTRHAVVKRAMRQELTLRVEAGGTQAATLARAPGFRAGLAAGLAVACLAGVAAWALAPRGEPPAPVVSPSVAANPLAGLKPELEAALAARSRIREQQVLVEQDLLLDLAGQAFDLKPGVWRPRIERQLALLRAVFDALGAPLRRVAAAGEPALDALPLGVQDQLASVAATRVRVWALLASLTPLRRFASVPPGASRNRIAYTVLGHQPAADREGLEVLADVATLSRAVIGRLARDGAQPGVDVARRLDDLRDAAGMLVTVPWDPPLRAPFREAVINAREELAALPDPRVTGLPAAAAEVWHTAMRGPAGATPAMYAAVRRVEAAFPAHAAGLQALTKSAYQALAEHETLLAELEPQVAKAMGMLSLEFSMERAAENTLPLQQMPRASLLLARNAADGWSNDPRVARLTYEAWAVYTAMVVRRDAVAELTERDSPISPLSAQVYISAHRGTSRAFIHMLRMHAQGRTGEGPSFPGSAFAFVFDAAMMLRSRPLPVTDQDLIALAALREDRLADLPETPVGKALAGLARALWRLALVGGGGSRDEWERVHASARVAFTSPTDREKLAKFKAEVERQLSKK